MLIEGYDLYLESIALLLVAFVFLFLILLSLLEWSGNKPMAQDRAEQELNPDQEEGEGEANNNNNEGSNYNNKAPNSDTQLLIDRYIGKVDFNMKSEDLDKPWFHKQVTRAMAQDMLKGKGEGSFIIRPSSQRGSYAMSWVKNETGEISHSLIHGLFPGFSLKQTPTLEERFWSLQSLVDNCPHLHTPVVSEDYISNKNNFQRSVARTSSEVIGRIVEKLYANNPALTDMKWHICILGEGTELYNSAPLEKRTFVKYCDEEYAAPELLPLNGNGLELVCEALHNNTTLRSLTITGHEGYMRMSFKPNIGDSEAAAIAKMLQVNKSITRLDLNINQITDTGAKVIAQGLTYNRNLRRLNLSNNFLSSEGLSYFAELMKTNPTLEDLDVRNQLHKNRANSVTLSCGDNTKQLISLIEDTMRRRAELVPISSSISSPNAVSTSPARSSFLSVFHGYLSKKKVERRLAPHIPGSFLFYLNRYVPNALYIGIVQDAPQQSTQGVVPNNTRKVIVHKRVQRSRQGYIFSGDAPQYTHEIEATVREFPPPKQVVPSLFEYCAWYIASNKQLLEYSQELDDEVLDRLKAVQMLVGLWGVKFFLPPSATPAPSPSSSSHKGHSSKSHHSSHRSSHHHSSHSPSHKSGITVKDPHYSTHAALSSPSSSPSPSPSPNSNHSHPNSGTDSDSATDSDTNSESNSNHSEPDTNSANNANSSSTTSHSSASNHSSHSNHHPNNNHHHHHSPAHHSSHHGNSNHHASPHLHHSSPSPSPLHNGHVNHVNHNHSTMTSRILSSNNSNVFTTISFLIHKNKSWLKYPVQVPLQDPQR